MSDETRTMTDPYQWLHDNEFSWDDVNAIAAILDHGGFKIVQAAALPTSTERLDVGRVHEIVANLCSALAITVTTVPSEGRPHWCPLHGGHHDATCTGMLKVQDLGRELRDDLAASLSPSPTETPE